MAITHTEAYTCNDCSARPLWMRLWWKQDEADKYASITGHTVRLIPIYSCAAGCKRAVETDGETCSACVSDAEQEQECDEIMRSLGASNPRDGVYRDSLGRGYRPIYEAGSLARIIRQKRKLHRWSVSVDGGAGTNAIVAWEAAS